LSLVFIASTFEKPTTKDFVWSCWGPSVKVFGVTFCYNFIFFLLTLTVLITIGALFLGLRKPTLVPGKFQLLIEMGFQFVRETVVMQMIGQEGMVFFAFLSALFFYILAGNILEVVPGINFTMNTRIAFPLVLATLAWIVFNHPMAPPPSSRWSDRVRLGDRVPTYHVVCPSLCQHGRGALPFGSVLLRDDCAYHERELLDRLWSAVRRHGCRLRWVRDLCLRATSIHLRRADGVVHLGSYGFRTLS